MQVSQCKQIGEEPVTFSIIIAAWNAEKTIQTAIKSVADQLKDSFEILIIDDCSTDHTYVYALSLAKNNPNIKVYQNKKNLGPSNSRNLGIKKAQGLYTGFLDADDFYSEGLFDVLLSEIKNKEPEVIKFGVREVYKKYVREVTSQSFYSNKKDKIAEKAISLEALPLFGYACNSFYKTELLIRNKISFDEKLRFAEDFFFNFCVFSHTNSFSFLGVLGYNYLKQSATSLSSQQISNYEILYQRKISILTSWALQNHCLSVCGKDLYFMFLKTLYSSAVRKIDQKKLRCAYKTIKSFYQLKERNILSPYFSGENLKMRIANFPLQLHSPGLVLFLSFLLAIIIHLCPNKIKQI